MTSPLAHLLIRASAGTGKTFQLSNRYISLLAGGVPPSSILATTFTRKAAGEIRDRILERLADAVLSPSAEADLKKHLHIPSSITPNSFESCFQTMLAELNRLNIGTLDSFFSVWTSKLALEFGLTPGWSMLSTSDYKNLTYGAIAHLVRYGKNTDLSRLLQLLNKGAVNRSVTENVYESIDKLRSLFLQSTRESWDQPLAPNRLPDSYLNEALDQLGSLVDHFDSNAIQNAIIDDLNLLRTDQYDVAMGKGLLKKIIEREPKYKRVEIPQALVSAYQPILEYLSNYYAHEIHSQSLAIFDLLERFTTSFNQLKRQANRLEFTDTTTFASQISDLPAGIFSRVTTGIDHLLLDEFQDTSLPQWLALSYLVKDVTQSPGGTRRSLFCVGDTKQAIYGWRGGRREIFETLSETVSGIETDSLKESYRSSKHVLNFINSVFMNLSNHPRLGDLTSVLAQWTKDFEEHNAALELDGYVSYHNADAGSSTKARLQACLRETVTRVQSLLDTGKAISIGVLLRKNDHIAELIQLLATEGIIASEEGGNVLTRFSPVVIIKQWLHLLEFPDDTLAYYQIKNSPLSARHPGLDSLDCMSSHVWLAERERLFEVGLGSYLAELSRYLDPYLTDSQSFRLQQLVQHADTFEADNPVRLTEFLQSIDAEAFSEETSASVRVMTIHSSKGLEFDAVILPSLETNLKRTPRVVVSRDSSQLPARIYPYRNAKIQAILPTSFKNATLDTATEQLQETLCVLYVAMTRAAHALYLIGPSQVKPPKDPPVTLAGLVQFAIQGSYDATPQSTVFEAGNANWYHTQPNCVDLVDNREVMPLGLNRSSGGVSSLPTASPSSLEGGDHFQATGLMRIPDQNALDYGSLVHQLFEEIIWWEASNCDFYLEQLTQRRIRWNSSLKDMLSQFAAFPDAAKVLTKQFYNDLPTFQGVTDLQVKVELPVTAIVNGNLIRGFADRIVLGISHGKIVAADIVDFKTDNLGEGNTLLSGKVEHYRPQLNAYRETIAQMLKVDLSQVTARLLFVTAGVHADLELTDK